jgi:hypothetical protein
MSEKTPAEERLIKVIIEWHRIGREIPSGDEAEVTVSVPKSYMQARDAMIDAVDAVLAERQERLRFVVDMNEGYWVELDGGRIGLIFTPFDTPRTWRLRTYDGNEISETDLAKILAALRELNTTGQVKE